MVGLVRLKLAVCTEVNWLQKLGLSQGPIQHILRGGSKKNSIPHSGSDPENFDEGDEILNYKDVRRHKGVKSPLKNVFMSAAHSKIFSGRGHQILT